MSYWENIVFEITNQNTKRIFLGDHFPEIYLTRREAQCGLLLIKGKSMVTIGKTLRLSTRTVEFYVQNIKNKLHCRTKRELVNVILKTNLMKWEKLCSPHVIRAC